MKKDSLFSVLLDLRRTGNLKAFYFFLLHRYIGLCKVHGKPVNIHKIVVAFFNIFPAIGKQKTTFCL